MTGRLREDIERRHLAIAAIVTGIIILVSCPAFPEDHGPAVRLAQEPVVPEPVATPDPTMPPVVEEGPDPFDAALAGGGILSFAGSESPSDYTARVETDGPLVVGGWDTARLVTRLDLTLDPDQGVQNVDAYKAVEFEGSLEQRISRSENGIIGDQRISTSVYVAGGFAAIRGKGAPNDSPGWWELGLKAAVREAGRLRAYLRLGVAADQRLDGDWQPVLHTSGAVEIPVAQGSRIKAMLVGDAIRAIGENYGGPRWQVRVGIMLGI